MNITPIIEDEIYMKKEALLKEIIDCYLESCDFNGLPVYEMNNYDYGLLCELIDEGLIEVLSEKEVMNPHIKSFEFIIPKDQQKKDIANKTNYSVLYPTKKALESVPVDNTKPYSALLQKGEIQLKIIYFDIEILERYFNNPKFAIMDGGYRGNIHVKDEYMEEDVENEYIKDYGMAYIDGQHLERAVGVFVCDLAKLSSQKQMLWKGLEYPNQEKCIINPEFVDSLIMGKWTNNVWIFHALIDEMKVINEQCKSMGIPELFNRTFGAHYSEMPEGFRNIFMPALKNYYDFVLVLEKITVHNISYKTFQKNAPYIRGVDRKDKLGKDKGSLLMLDEWLNKNIRTQENLTDLIVEPLKNIRKIRQKPAHELISNKYDVTLYQEQINLMNKTYDAIRALRMFFSSHPLAKEVKIPEHLISGNDIVDY